MLTVNQFSRLRHPAPCWLVWALAGALMPLLSSFDDRRLLLTAAMSIVTVWALLRRRFVTPHKAVQWAGSGILVLGLCSAALSAAPAWGLLGAAFTGLGVVAVVARGRDLRTIGAIGYARFVGISFVLPVILSCVATGATIYSALLSGWTLEYPEPLRDFANIRFFNQYQTWLLPFLSASLVLACPVADVRQTLWRTFLWVVCVFFFALYWRSSGRGTGYSTLLACVAVAVSLGPAGRAHAMRMAGLAIAGYAVNLAMFGLGPASNARMLSAASPGRWYLWDIALNEIIQHPWLGIGPLLFSGIDTGLASHPHNAVMQWMVEWGMPAAVLFVGTIGWLIFVWLRGARRALSKPDSPPQPLIVAVVASLLAGTAHALVSGVIVMPASQFMLIFVAAVAVALFHDPMSHQARSHQAQNDRPTGAHLFTVVGYCTAALAVVYVGVFTVHDYTTRVRHTPPQTSIHARNAGQPRYWADGTLVQFIPAETD